jgi:NAD-dependent deacetylase
VTAGPDANPDGVRRLAALLADSRRTVFFTGAGISTESGIPDFRSPGGIWTKYQPIEFDDFVASEEARRESWRRKFATETTVSGAAPNTGHEAVARIVASGDHWIVTQNVDGLHQKSGVAEDRIIELHGNSTYARCLDCGARYELEPIRVKFESTGELPRCTFCAGLIKTATISFGQPMPEKEMSRAEEVVLACDLLVVLGSSLVVYPAAAFPMLAKRNGAGLAIVNREPTEQDEVADLVLHAPIGAIMSAALAALG